MTKKQELQIVPVEEFGKELAAIDATEKAIMDLTKKYDSLAIKDLDDKEGYDQVHEARMDLKNKRVAVERLRKDHNKPYQDHISHVNSICKGMIALMEPTEKKLQEQEKAIDEEKERIKEEERRQKELQYQTRLNQLINNGMEFDGAQYTLNDLSIDMMQLKEISDEEWESFFAQVQEEYTREKEKIEKEKKKKDAEMEALRKELAEQKAKNEDLAKSREEKKEVPEELNKQPMTPQEAYPDTDEDAETPVQISKTTFVPELLMEKFLDESNMDILPADPMWGTLVDEWKKWIKKEKIFT